MGSSGYSDDVSISNDTQLWRRVAPQHIVPDENTGRRRPSSAAFGDHPNGSPMSVMIGDTVMQSGRGPNDVLVGYPGYGLASFTAGLARTCGQGVARDPTPNEPAHAVVFGEKPRPVRKRLAQGCEWVILPA